MGDGVGTTKATFSDWFNLMKPGVLALLQITALCAILIHDLIEWNHDGRKNFEFIDTLKTMGVVFVGGWLTAGGAHTFNNVLDRDIDPGMERTAKRAIARGVISPTSGFIWGVLISLSGVIWLAQLANEVAAFWAAFSILFYVFIYTLWLKRRSVQNIVIGGIAGATPPLVGWAAAMGGAVSISNPFALGSVLPWLMFILIFLWTPPHFWALALYRSDQYKKMNIPMMPWVKGPQRTLVEMRVYALLLIGISAMPWLDVNQVGELPAYVYTLIALVLGIWYNQSVINIDIHEPKDPDGRIPSAARSFFISLSYLALMFVSMVLVLLSVELTVLALCLVMIRIISKKKETNSTIKT
ncbi:MAG: heme o synthase [Candidatus Thalassarchaeaceae archaeon]|jgi:protoheme IX farnesyltransferase|nr:heme o synthase [Candidatus Thalassarchaeaceae archaeon]